MLRTRGSRESSDRPGWREVRDRRPTFLGDSRLFCQRHRRHPEARFAIRIAGLTSSDHSRSAAAASTALAAVIAVALLAFAWRGWYSRYIVDDFCTASQLRTMGFVEAMKYPREVWSGRYSYFFVKALFESVGPVTPRLTPALMMLLLGLAAALVARRLLGCSRVTATAFALAGVYAVIDSSPSLGNIGGALYWETGALTYFLPMALFTAWIALFGETKRSPAALAAASGVLMLAAGGLSETSLAAQGALTGGTLLLALLLRARNAAWIAAGGLLATAVALALVLSAPGNSLRAEKQTAPIPLPAAIERSLAYANRYVGSNVFVDGAALLPFALVTMLAGRRHLHGASLRPLLAGAAAIAAAAYAVSFLPGSWLLPAGPPERSLDIPNFFVVVLTAIAALSIGPHLLARPRASAALVLLCCLIPIRSIAAVREALPAARESAGRLDALDASLRARPGMHVTVRAPWALRMRIVAESPDYWSNQCMSRYYGLASLRVLE
jgi:hypothetical protein